MASQWFSCKGACSGSDKVSDTVKVDVSKLASDKENVQPLHLQNKTDDEAQKALKGAKEEQRQQQQKELMRQQQQKEAAERLHAEEQAKKRRQQEEVERRREEMAAAAERAAVERAAIEAAVDRAAAAAREICATREKARQEREAAARLALLEAQRIEQERAAGTVNTWCKANGFGDMNSQKKSFMSGSKFPLHEAVAKNNAEMVGLMVQLGADKELKNSKGQTAEDLARKMNKNGSMDAILTKINGSMDEC